MALVSRKGNFSRSDLKSLWQKELLITKLRSRDINLVDSGFAPNRWLCLQWRDWSWQTWWSHTATGDNDSHTWKKVHILRWRHFRDIFLAVVLQRKRENCEWTKRGTWQKFLESILLNFVINHLKVQFIFTMAVKFLCVCLRLYCPCAVLLWLILILHDHL